MAAIGSIDVECPACHETITIPVQAAPLPGKHGDTHVTVNVTSDPGAVAKLIRDHLARHAATASL